jgi:hypothetical protein
MKSFRVPARWLLAGLTSAVLLTQLVGCVEYEILLVEGLGFADRIRPDRSPLTSEQRVRDLRFGRYADGTGPDASVLGGELVSEIFLANLADRLTTNLPLSNCLWMASDANGASGDSLAMSWEVMATVSEGTAEETGFPRPLRLCSLTDEFQQTAVGTSSQGLMGGAVSALPINWDDEGRPRLERDVHGLGVLLTAHGPAQPDAYGRCPVDSDPATAEPRYEEAFPSLPGSELAVLGADFHYGTGALHVPTEASYRCPREAGNDCSTITCAKNCPYRPSVDAGDALSFRLGTLQELTASGELDIVLQNGGPLAERWMRPNVLAVREQRRIARRMGQLTGGGFRYAWSTPAAGPPTLRWHENFSPNLLVEDVRFFLLQPDGTELPLTGISGNRVLLFGEGGASWACEGSPVTGTFGIASCLAGGVITSLPVTPTYAVEQLSPAYGEPLAVPLRWEVAFLGDPRIGGAGEVYIELTVRAEFGEAGMTGRPLVVDLGDVMVGDQASDWAELTNVGGPTLEIEAIWIDGPDGGEFAHQIPVEPRAVPLPVDSVELRERIYAFQRGEDFQELGLLETWEDAEQQLTLYRMAPNEGEELELYGARVRVEHELLVAEPEEKLVVQTSAANVTRPLAQPLYSLTAPPFLLATGDSVRVRVTAAPRNFTPYGLEAYLWARAHPVSAPSQSIVVAVPLLADTVWGADPDLFPPAIAFHSTVYNVLLSNNGDRPLLRSWVKITGIDAAAFKVVGQYPTTRVIAPGEAEVFTLEYLHPDGAGCPAQPPEHLATFEVTTDVEIVTASLWGRCEP